MDIRVRQFEDKDAPLVATLHRVAIPLGFLSELGDKFLGCLYGRISLARGSCVLVAVDEDDACIGFVSGSIDVRECYRRVLLRGAFPLFRALLPHLLRASVVRRILRTLLYPVLRTSRVPSSNSCCDEAAYPAELLSIAVSGHTRGQGVGGMLVHALEGFFQDCGYTSSYQVVTDADDARSNAFYRARGFRFQQSFRHHKHVMNRYIKELSGLSANPK